MQTGPGWGARSAQEVTLCEAKEITSAEAGILQDLCYLTHTTTHVGIKLICSKTIKSKLPELLSWAQI